MLRKQTLNTFLLITIFSFLLNINCSYAQSSGNEKIDSLLNLSKDYYNKNNIEEAKLKAQAAFELSSNQENILGIGLSLQAEALSLIASKKKVRSNRKKAIKKLNESLKIFSSVQNTSLRIESLKYLKSIAIEEKKSEQASLYAKQINDLKNLMQADKEANVLSSEVDKLSSKVKELNNKQLQSELILVLQKRIVDSLEFQTERDSLILFQQESIVKEQESEIALQKSQNLFYYALVGILVVFVVFIFVRFKESKKNSKILALKNEDIQVEKRKSEDLLLNILPSVIAEELKINGKAQARRYNKATVFFSDFINFSQIANELTPKDLVALLHEYFTLFDSVMEEFQLEKIKTIGDAYMCVGGLPKVNNTHPNDVILAALKIQAILNKKKIEKQKLNQVFFEARIGIHTVLLVAGVVGSKKFAFDIWGDTVNVASRIEARGEAGKVNISQATYNLVKDNFAFTSRGKIPIKNLGEVKMYFVQNKQTKDMA